MNICKVPNQFTVEFLQKKLKANQKKGIYRNAEKDSKLQVLIRTLQTELKLKTMLF